MSAKKKPKDEVLRNRVVFMCNNEMLAQIDEFAVQIRVGLCSPDYSRSNAIRSLINKGIEVMKMAAAAPHEATKR